MADLPFARLRMPMALLAGLACAHASAQGVPPSRAVLEPAPGLQVSYERLGPEDTASPPGRFDGSVTTPAGTLRTTIRATPNEERRFQRGDTTFELPTRVFGGKLQVRELEAGGTAAAWRARLGAGLVAETSGEQTPVRNGQLVQLQHESDGGAVAAQAMLASSRTAAAQGSRWDVEFSRGNSLSRWSAGIDASARGYVSPTGGTEPRAGVRLGTQWLLVPHARLEARFTRQVRWDAEEPLSSVMLGTRFDLPRNATLASGVETDSDARHRASVTLTVPLEPR